MKVLKFGAIWCPECVVMKPRWAEIEKEMPELNAEYIDLDENKEAKKDYHIDHVPTFIFLDKDNNEILRLKGLVEKDDLIKVIKEHEDK